MTSLGLPLPHCSPIQHPLPSQPLAAYFSTRSTSVIVFSSPHPATSLQTVHAPQDPTARPQRYNTANNTSPAHTPHLQTLLTSHAHKLHYTPHTTHTPHHTTRTHQTHHTHTTRTHPEVGCKLCMTPLCGQAVTPPLSNRQWETHHHALH